MIKLLSPKLIHKDKRGIFLSLVNNSFSNVSLITSNKNTIRSNHYHLKDSHYIYVLKGEMIYYYKNLRSNKKVYKKKIKQGQIVFTPQYEVHATVFTKKTVLIVISKFKRSKKFYEKDTVRYNLDV